MLKREIELIDLPKRGIFVDWSKCVGREFKFTYGDIKGTVKIAKYDGEYLYLDYNNIKDFPIQTGHFTRCGFGNLLGLISFGFQKEKGDIIKDEKRDLTIIDRKCEEITVKTGKRKGEKQKIRWYLCHCNIPGCGYEKWIREDNLLNKKHPVGCACCAGKDIVEGINDLATTNWWMVDYFQEKDKWMTKKYSYGSSEEIIPICPHCGWKKDKLMKIQTLYQTHSIGCPCQDGISYPEKFMFKFLIQVLNKNFVLQLTKRHFKWIGDYRYDFYFILNGKQYIIETDGGFHDKNNHLNGQSREEINAKDELKDKLAKAHNIKVIRIDCKKSTLDHIKREIEKSDLKDLFDLSKIDWEKCHEYALSNLVKQACEYKKNNSELTTREIASKMKLSQGVIIDYLKQGAILKWCEYDPVEESRKSSKKNSSKPIEVFKNGVLLEKFESIIDLSRRSLEIFKIKLNPTSISEVCNGHKKSYKGFTFKFV